MANQTMAMTIDPIGKKWMISSQSMKCSPHVEKEKEPKDALKMNKEEPQYSPQSYEGEPEYSPQSDEEFDEDMYDDTNDHTYGDHFVVNCNIVSIFHAEYDMVSEVSETEEDFMPDETVGGKPLYYYVMNSGMVEEQKAMFERPSPGMMYHMKPLFIRAKVDGIAVNKVFVDGGCNRQLNALYLIQEDGEVQR